MYCEKCLDQDEDILDHIALQGMTLAVKGIKNHRYNEKSNQFEVLISWKGFDDEGDSWEPMTAMFAGIKVMTTKYLQYELAKKPNAKLKSFIETLV
jgi:hypothetical protein